MRSMVAVEMSSHDGHFQSDVPMMQVESRKEQLDDVERLGR